MDLEKHHTLTVTNYYDSLYKIQEKEEDELDIDELDERNDKKGEIDDLISLEGEKKDIDLYLKIIELTMNLSHKNAYNVFNFIEKISTKTSLIKFMKEKAFKLIDQEMIKNIPSNNLEKKRKKIKKEYSVARTINSEVLISYFSKFTGEFICGEDIWKLYLKDFLNDKFFT